MAGPLREELFFAASLSRRREGGAPFFHKILMDGSVDNVYFSYFPSYGPRSSLLNYLSCLCNNH